MTDVSRTQLRARFAERLSVLYGNEVPAYRTLVQVSHEVNHRVLQRLGPAAERLGSVDRVTAERHGAIRVGSPREMSEVARVFAALGMSACGFYDLRDAHPAPIPVVATAFRPLDRDEVAINPFRVFTSMLVTDDRRFFDADLAGRLAAFLDARRLFPPRLLQLADRAAAEGHLGAEDAAVFLDLATAAFALSREPVDRVWYAELERVSSVAADIGGVASTHINHLTPRVLDIDELYWCMQARGIEMIDQIQGPPRWDGPDVLLRQTSFRALAEPRLFRHVDDTVAQGALRVRFGEVESRGIALTPAGRDLYEQMVREVDEQVDGQRVGDGDPDRNEVAASVWAARLPSTEQGLCLQGLGYFTYGVDEAAVQRAVADDQLSALTCFEDLVHAGVLVPEPIVYEDFLPRSAAGIFASNLSSKGRVDELHDAADRTLAWMSDVIGAEVRVPEELYAEESASSLRAAERVLAASGAGSGINAACHAIRLSLPRAMASRRSG
ncbi:VOC family protein [Nocardioides sp. AN3]